MHWYPIADAFEVKVHRTALAVLVGLRRLELAASYLTTIRSRIRAEASDNQRDIVDPRISLTAAVLMDLRTAPANLPGAHVPGRIPSLLVGKDQAMARRLLDQAERAYAEAQRHPTVAAEAATRRALVLHRLGRHQAALEALDQADACPANPTVRYWTSLFRGRVLETLGRLDEARTAYEMAAAIWPGAQTPVVALAALLQRQGRVAEAIRAAEAARATPAGTINPWWQYWSGDLRFLDQWLGELRKVRP